jgi:hypothetical protein
VVQAADQLIRGLIGGVVIGPFVDDAANDILRRDVSILGVKPLGQCLFMEVEDAGNQAILFLGRRPAGGYHRLPPGRETP